MAIRAIHKAVQKKKKIKGLDNLVKINDYVNKPNELDIKVKQQQKNINKALKYIEELEKEVGILKTDSHPPLFTKKDKNRIERRLKKLEKRR